jgi:hypothetical protein
VQRHGAEPRGARLERGGLRPSGSQTRMPPASTGGHSCPWEREEQSSGVE